MASAETSSAGIRSATASATALLPLAVGPTSAITSRLCTSPFSPLGRSHHDHREKFPAQNPYGSWPQDAGRVRGGRWRALGRGAPWPRLDGRIRGDLGTRARRPPVAARRRL